MSIETFQSILIRDLDKLAEEIGKYEPEENIWKTSGGISNSAGNLCLHLCGNLRHFIGATLGGDGYVRNRDQEFASKNIPKEKLLEEIAATRRAVGSAFLNLDESKLKENYPLDVFGTAHTVEYFLTHLIAHLNYHLGQVNYHRRLL